jgi:hypothetical protein
MNNDRDRNLQDAISEDGGGSLLDAIASKNPKLKERLKVSERRRRFPQSERILVRLVARDDAFGERNRNRGTHVRLGRTLQARLDHFRENSNFPIELQRFFEVAVDELLTQLGEE